MMKRNAILFGIVSLGLVAACGGGNDSSVGPAGATLKAGAATLTIPANALTQNVQVTLREVKPEPGHLNRATRVEIEPRGTQLAHAAIVSVRVDDSNPRVTMHNGSDDSAIDTEVEDRNHHEFKTTMTQLEPVEVEVEHAKDCTPACPTGQECDDGTCKAHNDNAKVCNPLCASGQECDDGTCKTHGEVEGLPAGTPATCTPACGPDLPECDDGVCKAHKGA